MGPLGVTWADIWGPLGVAGELLGVLGRLGGAMGGLMLQNIHICEAKTDPGTKSRGAGRHQGCTKDAPGMHQGCTEWEVWGVCKGQGGLFLKVSG